MSGSSRSRSKHRLEPISIEELAGTTGMSGFCTFLTRDSSVAVPALDHLDGPLESTAPDPTAPKLFAPDLRATNVSAPVLGAGESLQGGIHQPSSQKGAVDIDAPKIAAPKTSAPEIAAPETSAPYLRRRRVRIRAASTVQDGHSLAEQAVYEAMYRAGRPHREDSRILTIGLRTLAEISRMAYSNCKLNVRSLVAKLAIDERPGFSYVDGRTYIIYEPGEIIDRRIAAGLTHVIRTRGVAFVNPVSGAPICSPHNLGAIKSGAPVNAESGALGVGGRLESWHLTTKQDEKLPAAPTAIVTALRRHVPDVDSEAASDLWRRCLEQAPEATVAEAVHFIDLKAGKPDIRMPLGFLLAAVPKCFQGDFYREFREQRARGREEAVSNRIFAQEVLRNPASDEEQRQWAREILGIRSEGPR